MILSLLKQLARICKRGVYFKWISTQHLCSLPQPITCERKVAVLRTPQNLHRLVIRGECTSAVLIQLLPEVFEQAMQKHIANHLTGYILFLLFSQGIVQCRMIE